MTVFAICLSVILLFSFAYYFLFGHLWSPSLLVLLWWTSWLLIAITSNIGFPRLSEAFFLSFLTFLVFFAIGSLFPVFLNLDFNGPKNDFLFSFNNTFVRWWSVVFIPVLIYFWRKASQVMASDSFLAGRGALIDFESSNHPVFGSSFVRNCIEVIAAGPLLYFSLFSFVYLLRDNRFLFSLVTCLGIYLYQSTELGRSQIYRSFLLLLVVFFFLWLHHRIDLSVKRLFFGGVLVFLIISYMFFATMSRFKNNPSASYKDISTELLSYHTAGFFLYDSALNDQTSPLNTELGYGRATFAGLLFPVTQVIRMFNKSYTSFLDKWYPYTASSKDLGIRSESGKEFFFNAYYTMLFPFYLDFRLFGICFFSFTFGLLTSLFFLCWIKTNSDWLLAAASLLFLFCVMNIFQPLTQRVYFFSSSFLLVFCFYYSHLKGRSHL